MIEVLDLQKHFRIRHNPVARLSHPDHVIKAVDGVSFEIEAGEILGMVGESGCGKTTLAKTMLRLYRPTGGRVLYGGRDVFAMSGRELRALRREVQVVFQDSKSTLDPRMTVGRILEEPLLLHKMGRRSWRKDRVGEVLQRLKLSPAFLARHPSELSGGQRQRVSMARALLLEPRAIIADEPLAGLDPVVSAQLLNLMLSLKRDFELAYLFISHDLDTVAYASDRVAVMYRGKIVEMVSGDSFRSEARHPYTEYLLRFGSTELEPLLDGGIHVHDQRGELGCLFRSRCPRSTGACAEAAPALAAVEAGHLVACHNAG